MAQMVNLGISMDEKVNKLRKSENRYVIQAFAVSIVILILLRIFISYYSMPALIVSAILIMIAVGNLVFCFRSVEYAKQEIGRVSAGNDGERATKIILSNLPDDYYVFSNVRVIQNGRDSEIDNVVISEHSVCIIETKHYSGSISGSVNDEYFERTKYDNFFKAHTSTFYNPIKQVQTHKRNLRFYLEDEIKQKFFIKNCVYFSNMDAKLYIKDTDKCNTPCFQTKESLLNYILESEDENKKRGYILPLDNVLLCMNNLRKYANVPKITPYKQG